MRLPVWKSLRFSALQLFFNQGMALVLFLFLSNYLQKNDFGSLNWSLAFLLISFSELSFGLDQLLVKKLAAGENMNELVSLYSFHSFFSGFLFLLILAACWYFFGSDLYRYLFLLGSGKFILSLSLPFKSIAAGKEQFNVLLLMSIAANAVKLTGLSALFFLNMPDLPYVILVFIAGDTAEFIVSFFLARRKFSINLQPVPVKAYLNFLKASLPQFGIISFAIALSRFDHVLLGMMTDLATVGEYSVASRIFEMACFPMLIIGPVLLPMAARTQASALRHQKLHWLLRVEMVLACFTIVLLNLLWSPVMDGITGGKYGKVNEQTVFLLSLSIPFLYLNNVLWSLEFSTGKLRRILFIFASAFLVNVTSNFLLIPFYGAEGAAMAYLLAIILQSALYVRNTALEGITSAVQSLFICGFLAIAIIVITRYLISNPYYIPVVGSLLFILLIVVAGQLKLSDYFFFRRSIRT